MYWLHLSKEYPYSSQYGVKELVNYVKENNKKDERVVVTDKYDQPYILFLFYLKYPPEQYQKSHTLSIGDRYGFSTVREFDKYEFHKIDFESELKKDSNSIIVGTDEEIPNDAKIIEEIYGTNGYKYFQVVAN